MTVYYKMRQILLQNTTAILLQNVRVITNCDNFITNCDRYYKMRCLLQIATAQGKVMKIVLMTRIHCSAEYLHFDFEHKT